MSGFFFRILPGITGSLLENVKGFMSKIHEFFGKRQVVSCRRPSGFGGA